MCFKKCLMEKNIVPSHLYMWTQTQAHWNSIYEAVGMVLKQHWQFFQQNIFLFDVLLEHKITHTPPFCSTTLLFNSYSNNFLFPWAQHPPSVLTNRNDSFSSNVISNIFCQNNPFDLYISLLKVPVVPGCWTNHESNSHKVYFICNVK